MEDNDTATITVTGNENAVEIVTMHDDAPSPSAVIDQVPTKSKVKRARVDKGKGRCTSEDDGMQLHNGHTQTPPIMCGTILPNQQYVVQGDGSRVRVKNESDCKTNVNREGTSGGRCALPTVRYFVCVDHDTHLGSFGSCTVIVAGDVQAAQDTLDEWLKYNQLQTREQFPYRITEIVPRKRGVTLVNAPISNSLVPQSTKSTVSAMDDVEMKFEDLHLFVYRDIEKCSPTLSGAVIFAMSAADALLLLNEELSKYSLLPYKKVITEDMVTQESTSILWSRGRVIPLSVYMVGGNE